MSTAYDELIDFIVTGASPRAVIAFQPSQGTKDRVADLIAREKTEGLTPEETAELDNYMHIEHIMRLAKARAHLQLAGK